MNTMCYYPGYHHNGFDNIYQSFIKIKYNREMVGKICPNKLFAAPHFPSIIKHSGKICLHVAFTVF